MSATETSLLATPGGETGFVELETRFVEVDVYCGLITSRCRLVRMDDPARGLRGVFDPDTRICYVVEERKLLRSPLRNRPETSTHG